MIDLDELQSVRDTERRTDKLQQLRDSFYSEAGDYIQQLRRERERAAERADDPFDAPEVAQLTDEIDTAEGTVEAVFERRIGKIVKAASLAAADQPIDDAGMTAEERALFEDLVDDIIASRQRVLDTLAGEDGAEAEPDRERDTGDQENADPESPEVGAADLMGEDGPAGPGNEATPPESDPGSDRGSTPGASQGAAGGRPAEQTGSASEGDADPTRPGERGAAGGSGGHEPERGESEPPVGDGGTVDRATVQVTADVGAILGVDGREYDLATDDVVQLPAANADPLVDRGAAERLDGE
jgi:DNA replication factor GINS